MAGGTMTPKEFADEIGCGVWLVYDMVKSGTCPVAPIKLGARKIVFARQAVEKLLAGEASPEPSAQAQ